MPDDRHTLVETGDPPYGSERPVSRPSATVLRRLPCQADSAAGARAPCGEHAALTPGDRAEGGRYQGATHENSQDTPSRGQRR